MTYDKQTYKYSLRHAETTDANHTQANIDISKLSQAANHQTTGTCQTDATTSGSRQNERAVKARYIGRNDEYKFVASNSTGPNFFDVSTKSRTVEITLNQNHPIFVRLSSLLGPIERADNEAIHQRLLQAKQTFALLLAAWAKYENDLPDGQRRFRAEEARSEWGRSTRILLMDELDDE